jgi:hypothetical protein
MAENQNYKNHAQFFPLFHYFVAPLALIYLIYAVVRLVQEPSVDRAFGVLLGVILLGTLFAARTMVLKVQDRIIRLEEQLRYQRVLPHDLAFQAENLPLNQIIALRFASDKELPELVTRVLGGEISKPNDIKLAVKDWRGDYSRA